MKGDRVLPRGSLKRFRDQVGLRFKDITEFDWCDSDYIIAVGDYTSARFVEVCDDDVSIPHPRLSIYDGDTKRQKYGNFESHVLWLGGEYIQVQNPMHTITKLADDMVEYAIEHGIEYIKVDGAEDLLAISAILHAPYDAYVVFGIPDEGVEIVRVTKRSKQIAEDLYDSMRRVDLLENTEVYVAGTFATVHDGHKRLFDMAFSLEGYVYVGVMCDEFAKSTREGEIPDMFARKQGVEQYLKSIGKKEGEDYRAGFQFVASPNVLENRKHLILVCSDETLEGAYAMNRVNGGRMEIVSVEVLTDENGEKISSSRILGYKKKEGVKDGQ